MRMRNAAVNGALAIVVALAAPAVRAEERQELGVQDRLKQVGGVLVAQDSVIVELNQMRSQLQDKVDSNEAALGRARGERALLNNRLQEYEAVAGENDRAADALQHARDSLQEKIKDYDAQIAMLTSVRNAAQAQSDVLKAKLQVNAQQGKDADLRLAQIAREIDGLQLQVRDASQAAIEKDKAIGDLELTREQYARREAGVDERTGQLAGELQGLRSRLDTLRLTELGVEAQIDQLTAALQSKERTLKEFAKTKDDLTMRLASCDRQANGTDTGSLKDLLREQLKSYTLKQQQIESDCAALRGQLEAATASQRIIQKGQKDQLTAALAEKEKALNGLTQDKQAVTAQLNAVDAQIDAAKREKLAVQARADQAQARIASLRAEAKEVKVAAAHDDLARATLEGQANQLAQAIALKDSIIADFRQSRDRLAQQRNECEQRQTQALTQQAGISQQVQQLGTQIADKDRAIAGIQAERNQFDATLKEYDAKLMQLENDRAALRAELEEYRAKQPALLSQVQQLAGQLADRDKMTAELNQSKEQLSARLKEAESKLALFPQGYETTVKDLQDKEQTLTRRQEELHSALADREKSVTQLLAQVNDLQAKLNSLEQQGSSSRARQQELSDENKRLKERVAESSKKIAQVAPMKDRLTKENAVLHYNLGVFHLERQNYNDAIVEFSKALELNPRDAAAHYNLGLIYAEYIGNRERALFHFKKYLMLDPKDKDADKARKYVLTWETWSDDTTEAKR